jgi:hypothetical protein
VEPQPLCGRCAKSECVRGGQGVSGGVGCWCNRFVHAVPKVGLEEPPEETCRAL